MPNAFLQNLTQSAQLTDQEVAILDMAGVRSAEDVNSLLSSFPSLSDQGVRVTVISNAVASQLGSTYSSFLSTGGAQQQPDLQLGALPPDNALYALNAQAPMPGAAGIATAGGAPAQVPSDVDVRLSNWPVRDQAHRGTCVAFGSTACVEHLCATQASGTVTDLSEQFLYWAIKDHSNDPNKSSDGTYLQYAADMLKSDGICTEDLWPYVGTSVSPVSGQTGTDPSDAAKSDAGNRELSAACKQANPTGAAATVCQLLHQNNRPVAICVPVFGDPAQPPTQHGWGTAVAWSYGRILNPPPGSVVRGGHCVCVTGFVGDANEPNGGYFIFRNSWSTAWAANAPSPGNTNSPEPGYGEISATYVQNYCWELMQL